MRINFIFHYLISVQCHLLATFVTILKIPIPNFYCFCNKYTVCLIPLLSFVFEIFNFEIRKYFSGHRVLILSWMCLILVKLIFFNESLIILILNFGIFNVFYVCLLYLKLFCLVQKSKKSHFYIFFF